MEWVGDCKVKRGDRTFNMKSINVGCQLKEGQWKYYFKIRRDRYKQTEKEGRSWETGEKRKLVV